jgi:hypothetical protein
MARPGRPTIDTGLIPERGGAVIVHQRYWFALDPSARQRPALRGAGEINGAQGGDSTRDLFLTK